MLYLMKSNSFLKKTTETKNIFGKYLELIFDQNYILPLCDKSIVSLIRLVLLKSTSTKNKFKTIFKRLLFGEET